MSVFSRFVSEDEANGPWEEALGAIITFVVVLSIKYLNNPNAHNFFNWLGTADATDTIELDFFVTIAIVMIITNIKTQKLLRVFGTDIKSATSEFGADIKSATREFGGSIEKLISEIEVNYGDFMHRGGTVSNITRQLVETSFHQDRFIAYPALKGLKSFFSEIQVTNEKIELQSYYMAKRVYNNFWEEIIKINRNRSNAEKITIYACHAANLTIWQDIGDEEDETVTMQKQFCSEGGAANRILIRGPHSTGTPDEYRDVRDEMERWGINACIYEMRSHSDKISSKYDFMLCNIDETFYVLTWDKQNRFGEIEGCSISYSKDICRDYIKIWNRFVDLLEKTAPQAHLNKIIIPDMS